MPLWETLHGVEGDSFALDGESTESVSIEQKHVCGNSAYHMEPETRSLLSSLVMLRAAVLGRVPFSTSESCFFQDRHNWNEWTAKTSLRNQDLSNARKPEEKIENKRN